MRPGFDHNAHAGFAEVGVGFAQNPNSRLIHFDDCIDSLGDTETDGFNQRRRGAAANKQFREAPLGENPVLDYVGVCHLMEARHGANIRVLSTWGKRLEAVGLWYDQLLSESLGKNGQGAMPLTVVNTRDLHSRGQQHQQGRRDKLITNLGSIAPPPKIRSPSAPTPAIRTSSIRWPRGRSPRSSMPRIAEPIRRIGDDGRPTAEIRLPGLDEGSLGSFSRCSCWPRPWKAG